MERMMERMGSKGERAGRVVTPGMRLLLPLLRLTGCPRGGGAPARLARDALLPSVRRVARGAPPSTPWDGIFWDGGPWDGRARDWEEALRKLCTICCPDTRECACTMDCADETTNEESRKKEGDKKY